MKNILKGPLLAQCEITEHCNYICGFCYNYWRKENNKGTYLSPKKIKIVVDRLAALGIMSLSFTGGEPSFLPESLEKGIKYALQKNILVSVNTNLSILNERNIRIFIDKGVYFLASFPSCDENEYNRMTSSSSYRNVVKKTEFILKHKGMIAINMVVCDINVERIKDTGFFVVKKMGVSVFRATPVSPPKYLEKDTPFHLSQENYELYFKQIRELKDEYGIPSGTLGTIPFCMIPKSCRDIPSLYLGCTAGKSIITIGADGTMRPCSQAEFSIGNIFKIPSNKFVQYVQKRLLNWRQSDYLPTSCLKCAEAHRCNGGCRMFAYHCSNELNAEDPRMTKPLLKPLVKFSDKNSLNIPKKCEGQCYRIKKQVRYREEKKGTWTIFSGDYYDFINDDMMKLFKYFFIDCCNQLPHYDNKILSSMVDYFVARNYIERHNSS